MIHLLLYPYTVKFTEIKWILSRFRFSFASWDRCTAQKLFINPWIAYLKCGEKRKKNKIRFKYYNLTRALEQIINFDEVTIVVHRWLMTMLWKISHMIPECKWDIKLLEWNKFIFLFVYLFFFSFSLRITFLH